MKIGLLLYKNVFGGVETVSIKLARLLAKQGHEVFFIFPSVVFEKNIQKIPIDNEFKIYEYPITQERFSVKDMMNFIVNAVNQEDADVVISMFLQESHIFLKAKKYMRKNVKLVNMRHDGCFKKLNGFWSNLELKIYNDSDAVITIKKIDENYYKNKIKTKLITIPNLAREEFNVDIRDFHQKKNKKILALGRMVNDKGFDLLIKAFSYVEDWNGWTLHIYGDGVEKENLLKLVNQFKMQEKIFIYPTHANVPALMNESDIFVLSSRAE